VKDGGKWGVAHKAKGEGFFWGPGSPKFAKKKNKGSKKWGDWELGGKCSEYPVRGTVSVKKSEQGGPRKKMVNKWWGGKRDISTLQKTNY